MGYKNREIETKLLVQCPGETLGSVARAISAQFSYTTTDTIVGHSKDIYWSAAGKLHADFIRLRYHPNGPGQITAKYSDKGVVTDRVEIDVTVDDPEQAQAFLRQVLGKPEGTIRKKYFVYFLGNEHTTVSVYKVDKDPRIFVEVEAKSHIKMDRMIKRLGRLPWKFEPISRSLYSIFFGKKLTVAPGRSAGTGA